MVGRGKASGGIKIVVQLKSRTPCKRKIPHQDSLAGNLTLSVPKLRGRGNLLPIIFVLDQGRMDALADGS